jgi:hypothetical protein
MSSDIWGYLMALFSGQKWRKHFVVTYHYKPTITVQSILNDGFEVLMAAAMNRYGLLHHVAGRDPSSSRESIPSIRKIRQ